jgi:hypothetical protein
VNYSKDLLPLASSAQRVPPGLMDDRSKVLSDKQGGAATVLSKKSRSKMKQKYLEIRSNNQRNGIAAKKIWREEQPTKLQQKKSDRR